MAYFFKSTKSLLIIMLAVASLLLTSCKTQQANLQQPENNSDNQNKIVKESKKVSTVITTARTYIGTKYQYGGCSRSGIDCSGLIYTCYKSVNKELPRTAGAQSECGHPVKINELHKGDLLFFTDQKGHSKITHVGLVTEVGKDHIKFIHASSHKGVIEADLLSAYYKPLFLKAVRII
ncbi:MAG TPA: C40 family peptidase [Cytophagaceae bacterium]|jgi:probable lipoprotein NlpC|nr:C40 family peptidase [Cytophagaceae bacterium]